MVSKNKLPPNIGPGSYQIPTNVTTKKMRNSNAPFLSTNTRFMGKEQ